MTALKVSEKEWQQTVIDAAQRFGWRVAHFRTSRTQSGGWATAVQADGAGFPDLVCVRGPRLLFAELKAAKGRIAPTQAEWLADLTAVCSAVEESASMPGWPTGRLVEVYVWRPSDWLQVEETLR